MIRKAKEGDYELFEAKNGSLVMNLNGQGKFLWLNVDNSGEVLTRSAKNHKPNKIFTKGYFRIYDITGEPSLTNLPHLEVCVGRGQWQGYLLPKGLPGQKGRSKIIPTAETISKGSCNC